MAAVVPMDEYRRWHSDIQKADGKEPKSKKTAEPSESSLAYELPPDLLAEYHRLLDKKFSEGLTPEEEAELERVGKELDEADMNTPLGQAILTQAQAQHEQWMRRMDKVMETLRTLKELS